MAQCRPYSDINAIPGVYIQQAQTLRVVYRHWIILLQFVVNICTKEDWDTLLEQSYKSKILHVATLGMLVVIKHLEWE